MKVYQIFNTQTRKFAFKGNATTPAIYKRKVNADKYAEYLNQGLEEKPWIIVSEELSKKRANAFSIS